MKKAAISIGDINGISPEIILRAHEQLCKICTPHYIVHKALLDKAASLLNLPFLESNFIEPACDMPEINPGKIQADAGKYSFESFKKALSLCDERKLDFTITLPIHKLAWAHAKIPHIGHTEALNKIYNTNSIMLLGSQALYVALYTHHIPLKDVAKSITKERYLNFLLDFANFSRALMNKNEQVAIIALNPHAGDGGLIGSEDLIIDSARARANEILKRELFSAPIPPDSAFTPHMRERYKIYVAPYHDIGLAPLKALYFSQSINITLGLPVIRTSPDHGVGFDIAYKNAPIDITSYLNCAKLGVRLSQARS